MSDFVDTPMSKEFVHDVSKGGPGVYDHNPCPAFSESRTSSPNGVPEKFFEKEIPSPSGESDQY